MTPPPESGDTVMKQTRDSQDGELRHVLRRVAMVRAGHIFSLLLFIVMLHQHHRHEYNLGCLTLLVSRVALFDHTRVWLKP